MQALALSTQREQSEASAEFYSGIAKTAACPAGVLSVEVPVSMISHDCVPPSFCLPFDVSACKGQRVRDER